MNKRSVPIAIVSCLLALAGIAGYFVPDPVEATPSRLLMENPGGRVVFTHQAHATPGGPYGDSACADCHHELKAAPWKAGEGQTPPVMPCTACHGSADDPGFIASHQEYWAKGGDLACASCHHARVAGFSDKWNHEEHWDYAGDCATCHHTEGATLSGRRMKNIQPQRCANCHTAKPNPMTPRTGKDAGHKTCASCHSDLFTAGAEGCKTCHDGQSTRQLLAEGRFDGAWTGCGECHKPISSGMEAFHNQCMSCHDKAGKGPGKKAPCAQCHAP